MMQLHARIDDNIAVIFWIDFICVFKRRRRSSLRPQHKLIDRAAGKRDNINNDIIMKWILI